MNIFISVSLFILAGFCEIGGGYLIWLWLKEDKPFLWGAVGAFILIFYAVVATWQTEAFGKVYAAYGGIFIFMSLLWGWKLDNQKPDVFDITGAAIALVGVLIIMFMPRN